jgi:hypothetical protein
VVCTTALHLCRRVSTEVNSAVGSGGGRAGGRAGEDGAGGLLGVGYRDVREVVAEQLSAADSIRRMLEITTGASLLFCL